MTVVVGGLEAEAGFFVADDGPGIPDSDSDALFQPGYSSDAGNTGHGLNFVQEIAEAHGWSVDVTESAGGGARFGFRGVELA